MRGLKDSQPHELTIELIDKYDEKTGFTCTERVTGWHAAIVLEMAVQGKAIKGVVPLERAVDPVEFISQARQRGFKISERLKKTKKL